MSRRIFKKKKKVFNGTRYADIKFKKDSVPEASEDQPTPTSSHDLLDEAESISPGLAQSEKIECTNKNDIVDIEKLGGFLNLHVCCKTCGGNISLSVSKRVGLAAEILVSCSACKLAEKQLNCTKHLHPEPNG